MCWDEGWEDQWLAWWGPDARAAAIARPPHQEDGEVNAAVRKATELTRPSHTLARMRFPSTPVSWLRVHLARSVEHASGKEPVLTGRR